MKIERTMRVEMPVADTYAMSILQEYQEKKCRDAGALSYDVHIEDGTDGALIKTKRKLPTVGFPSLLRKFVPSGVTSTETVKWGAAGKDGRRVADLSVDFHGAPASMHGTVTLRPAGDAATEVVVDAEFKAHVPIVGKKVEGFAASIILSVIDSEEATGKAWAAGDR